MYSYQLATEFIYKSKTKRENPKHSWNFLFRHLFLNYVKTLYTFKL